MASFNFIIYYRLEVKISYTDFIFKIDIFFLKKDTNILSIKIIAKISFFDI